MKQTFHSESSDAISRNKHRDMEYEWKSIIYLFLSLSFLFRLPLSLYIQNAFYSDGEFAQIVCCCLTHYCFSVSFTHCANIQRTYEINPSQAIAKQMYSIWISFKVKWVFAKSVSASLFLAGWFFFSFSIQKILFPRWNFFEWSIDFCDVVVHSMPVYFSPHWFPTMSVFLIF